MKYDNSMMATAKIWSKESYCKKRQVGCVIASNERIITHGHNGTISGFPNICEETEMYPRHHQIYGESIDCVSCEGTGQVWRGLNYGKWQEECEDCNGHGKLRYIDKTNDFTFHAEANAILHAARNGYKLEDSTIYITLSPCVNCSKLIAQSGIKRVVYEHEYKDTAGLEFLKKCNIIVTQLTME